MNAVIKAPMQGEILPPTDVVRAVGLAHPLKGKRIDLRVSAGLSITEVLQQALAECPGTRLSPHFAVQIDGHSIPFVNWSKVRLKAGTTVTFRPTLHGDNPLKTILGVAIAVAALVVAGPLGSALAASALGTALGISAGIGTALVSAGVLLAGTMALNAIFPTRPPQLDGLSDSSSRNSIQGANNQANPFGPIPVVLGRHRQSPYFAAKPYTEIVGDDQFLRLLFCFGYGPLNLTDFKIGETALSAFADAETEVLQGFVDDAKPTLYPSDVHEEALSIELTYAGGWQVRTTPSDTDEISIDFTAPEGVFSVNSKTGSLDSYTVIANAEYRAVGDVDWLPLVNHVFTRSPVAARFGARVSVERGQYEVRTRKGQNDANTASIKEKLVWTALRSFKNVSPVNFEKPLALVSMRIRATDQLSGVVDTFNAISESLATAFDGEEWVENVASQWPSDHFRLILQGPANARPVSDEQIDLENLEEWHAFCVANNFRFNQVRGSVSSVADALDDVASAGRASRTFIDGKFGVIWDRPNDTIVQHFTPRNSWGFSSELAYAQQPHGFRVKFINEANGFTQDERIVYDDGYNESNATLFEGLEFPGVTDPDLIWKHGRFHIAQSRLRRERATISAGWEHLVCTRGDRVHVTHDVLLIGQAAGRVKAVNGQVVKFDETVTLEPGKTYGFRFRVPEDDRSIVRAVDPGDSPEDAPVGEYNELTLVGDLSLIVPGTLFGFGETGQEAAVYRVFDITNQKDLVATLVLVDDAPAISTADQGAIPAFDSHVTVPVDPFTLPPGSLQYLETIDGQGASARVLVRLSWQVPRFGKIASFEVQQRDDNANGPFETVDSVVPPRTSSSIVLASAGTWSFRVRCIFSDGTASDWSVLDHLTLQGLVRAPVPVANLRNTYIAERMHLQWDAPVDARPLGIEIRKGSSFDAAQIVADDAVNPWQTVGDDTYWVTSYATTPFGARVYSEPRQSISIERSVALENVIVSHDEKLEGWTGYFSGTIGKDSASNTLRTSGGDSFLSRADFLGSPNFIDEGAQSGGFYWSKHVVNAGRRAFCRVSNDWTATGVPVDADFIGTPDFLGQADFLASYLSQFIRVRPVIRISKEGPGDAFAEANIFEPDDAFLAGSNWEEVKIWSPDVYDGWLFQCGIQFEILTDVVPDPKTIAYLLSWVWTVDVPDRFDSYQNLSIPVEGLTINFRPTGEATDAPFNGGLNSEALPHITSSIRNPIAGDVVTWENLTLASVRVFVKNGGAAVARNEVNLLVRGY